MALFKKRRPDDPIASLEARLTAERAKRDNIAERLRAAEVGAAERRAAAEALAAAGGSDRELDGIEAQIRAFEDRARTLSSAVSTVDSDIAELEQELAAAKQRKQAAAVADELDKMAHRLAELYPVFTGAMGEIIGTIRNSPVSTHDLCEFANTAAGTCSTLAQSLALVVDDLRHRSKSVRAGTNTRFRIEEARPTPVLPPPVDTERVFVRWQGLKWRNPASGEIETAPRLTPADLPRELAAVARWHNLAVEPDSDHARTLAKGHGPSWQKPLAEAPGLADLDVLAAQDAAEQDATATVGAVA
jgi:hypothetical protein